MITVYLTSAAGELLTFKSDSTSDIYAKIVKNSWIYLTEPTEEEILKVSQLTKIDEIILRTALDEEETAHIDSEGDVTTVIIDTPIIVPDVLHPQINHYTTTPLSILYNKDFIVTACVKKDLVVPNMFVKAVKNFSTEKRIRLAIQILYRNATMFVTMLKQLDKDSEYIQTKLQEAMKNSELFELMNLSKSLVYLSTGLNADIIVLEKLRRTDSFKQFEEGLALIDDAIIENRQAIEMSTIHREILNGIMDTYASVISNNVNTVMKTLTVVTIVLTIPMIVASFFGMNFEMPIHEAKGFWFAIVASFILSILCGFFLARYTSTLKFQWGTKRKFFGKPNKKK